jgi:hypothetical protein
MNIGLGFGFGLGLQSGGSWISGDEEARNALIYWDWKTGRYAVNGVPVGHSQTGDFSRAGGAYEEEADADLDFLGANVPRLADHSNGARRFLMEGQKSKEPIVSIPWGS